MELKDRITLNNGVEMQRFGLGVYQSAKGDETQNAVRFALEAGYRHIDTARVYRNEKDVGKAIRESGIPRSELFVTTKLWNDHHGYDRTIEAFQESNARLGLEYIDLFLIHWPVEKLRLDSWRAMETLLEDGACRAIGVSNYMVRHLKEVLEHGNITPAVNQFELSPYCYQSRKEVVDFCREHGIQVEAYSPLTKGEKLRDPRLVEIAEKYNKTPAQVLIRWALEHDFVVIPKSVNKKRIQENADVFDFSITKEDMETLNNFDENFITSWDPTHVP